MARRTRSRTRKRRTRRRGPRWGTVALGVIVVSGAVLLLGRDGAAAARLRDVGHQLWQVAVQAASGAAQRTDPSTPATPAGPGQDAAALAGLRADLTRDQALTAIRALTVGTPTLPGTTDYRRDDYGERWEDVDGNGCNQRDDVLLRDARPGTAVVRERDGCPHDVTAGSWDDPYTGVVVTLDDLTVPEQAQAVTIDHVVPLAEAHRSGAAAWDPQRRLAFANDLSVLVAVDGPTNSDKGDADPATWRPPQESAWCAYALIWVGVKQDWDLAVDPAEATALQDMLARC